MRFEASGDAPISKISVDLEGDGEPSIEFSFVPENKRDGRYARALAFKPTVNGTWPLIVTAVDALGQSITTRCDPGTTVTF